MSDRDRTKKSRIAVLASGRGSNLDAIQNAIAQDHLHAEIVAVLSDRESPALSKARLNQIPAVHVPRVETRLEHEKRILKALSPFSPDFLVLAGYMRILTPYLVDAFRCERGYSRMINIHPSLLPAFPGVRSYAQAFRYGVKWTGVTVHLVEAEVDGGPICAQEAFSIEHCRSEPEVEAAGLKVEHRLYPETLEWVLAEKFKLEQRLEGRFYVRPN